MGAELPDYQSYFNSRPHGGRQARPIFLTHQEISTHALTEGDLFRSSTSCSRGYFNSRPHGGRLVLRIYNHIMLEISTHALTEGDPRDGDTCVLVNISTHALTEGDPRSVSLLCVSGLFQLTPSRRATYEMFGQRSIEIYFNSRPHGGRRQI